MGSAVCLSLLSSLNGKHIVVDLSVSKSCLHDFSSTTNQILTKLHGKSSSLYLDNGPISLIFHSICHLEYLNELPNLFSVNIELKALKCHLQ